MEFFGCHSYSVECWLHINIIMYTYNKRIPLSVWSILLTFLNLWLPIYFQRPLTLAKILGAYSIGFCNYRTGSSKRLDVLVMENLLYEHSTNKVFDLKDSMRSRFIDPSKESSGDVLLDENYLQCTCYLFKLTVSWLVAREKPAWNHWCSEVSRACMHQHTLSHHHYRMEWRNL